jgi:transposase
MTPLSEIRQRVLAYFRTSSATNVGGDSDVRQREDVQSYARRMKIEIAAIVDDLTPNLVARNSIGHHGAAQLLLTTGDNPERLRSEASFAALYGVGSVPASSGKTIRHRLNRGGDRQANSTLHIIAIGRLRTNPKTKAYVARRIGEGNSKLDAIRALKRYIAREMFNLIAQRQKEINQTRIATRHTEGRLRLVVRC